MRGLGLAAASGLVAAASIVNAQAPVITSPLNINYLNSNEAFDPLVNAGMGSWAQRVAMPTARNQASVAVINGIIYVFGGIGNSGILATV